MPLLGGGKTNQRKNPFSGARGERGQAALIIAMMTTTFLLFIAFVLNIGMLVNAKINLQNAADMAAYAGAAAPNTTMSR